MTDFSASHIARHALNAPRAARKSLMDYLALRRQRRALRQLDANGLSDIGLTQAQAEAEARRPFWDAPQHWKA